MARHRLAVRRTTTSAILLGGALLTGLPGCVERQYPPPVQLGGANPNVPAEPLGAPAAAAGRRVAILAPTTGPNAERGDALVKAAQLAMVDSPLDVRDTGGTAAGAAAAAAAAIAAGAGVLIGPLTGAETQAVAPVARAAHVPVLAFTNDSAVGGNGVWALGITPVQQVRRLVAASVAQGKGRFAAVLPDTGFGHSMGNALGQATAAAGVAAPDIRFHGEGTAAIQAAMREVSGYATRRGPLDAQLRDARARHDAAAVAELKSRGVGEPPFDTLLLADTGDRLALLVTFLPYYDIDPSSVRLLGPSLWATPALRGGANVGGAWYAAPDPAARAGFDSAYTARYGSPAPGLADLAYDAASIARLGIADGFAPGTLERPDGYAGVDGLLALQPDGTVRRALAVYQVGGDTAQPIQPAPGNLSDPGS